MTTIATEEILRSQLHDLELRAEQINAAIAHLRATIAALDSGTEYAIHAPVVRSGSVRARKKTRRAERLEDRVLAALDAAGGKITSSAVRLATGAESHHVAAALRSLETRGIVRATDEIGQRVAGRGPAPKVYRRVGLPQSTRSTREIAKS